jgi:hypothetical protein
VRERLERLQREFGGRIVEPLHLTLERTDGKDASNLLAAVREYAMRARPVAVRGERLFVIPSPYRGNEVLKLHVSDGEQIRGELGALQSAIRTAGLRSLYGDDRSTSVTVLEQVERDGPLDGWPHSLQLFTADELIVSRILGASRYEILDRIVVT